MDREKYLEEAQTLQRFTQTYCNDNHRDQERKQGSLRLERDPSNIATLEFELCGSCEALLAYAIARLDACPMHPKPRCRKCPNRCYDKTRWKSMAAMMRYSGIRFGLVKIKKMIGNLRFKR